MDKDFDDIIDSVVDDIGHAENEIDNAAEAFGTFQFPTATTVGIGEHNTKIMELIEEIGLVRHRLAILRLHAVRLMRDRHVKKSKVRGVRQR